MISNINESHLRSYSKLPKEWNGRPSMMNYDKASSEIHYEDGWRDIVMPELKENQQYGKLIQVDDLVTYEVVNIPEPVPQVPFSVTPTQGRIQLKRMGLLDSINAMVEASEDAALVIYWEYALSWDRDNDYINAMAKGLGMSKQELDQFFIEASSIV